VNVDFKERWFVIELQIQHFDELPSEVSIEREENGHRYIFQIQLFLVNAILR
jgi:hypothetical protein